MLRINSVVILRKSVNYRVNLFSKRNMNSTIVGQSSDFEVYPGAVWEPVKLIGEVGLGILSRRGE